jgi:hypothetical protein
MTYLKRIYTVSPVFISETEQGIKDFVKEFNIKNTTINDELTKIEYAEQYANARILEEQLKLLNKIKTKFQQYDRFNPVFAEYLDDIEKHLKEVKQP